MKKTIICSTILLSIMFTSCSGDKEIPASDVPASAVTAFNARYPTASGVKWITEEKNGKKLYEAQFKLENQNFEAEFDADGVFIAEQ